MNPRPERPRPGRRPRDLAAAAAALYAEGPTLLRALQRWRPYISPFDRLLDCVPPGSSVLDVGCGGGLFLALLAHENRIRLGVGFDANPAVIDLAGRMAKRAAGGGSSAELRFERRDVADPWPGGTFDVVSVIDVLHHVPTAAQRAALAAAAERVAPGGRLLYKDMCRRPLWRAAANQLHDLVVARQWIHHVAVEEVEQWASETGLRLALAERVNRLCYGHDLRVFERPAPGAGTAP